MNALALALLLAAAPDLPADWHAAARDLRDDVAARREHLDTDPSLRHKLDLATLYHGLGSREGVLAAGYFRKRFPEKAAAAGSVLDLPDFLASDRYRAALRVEGDRFFPNETAWPRDAVLAERVPPPDLAALLANRPLVRELAAALRSEDYLPGAWQVLADLQAAQPGAVARHPRLAVALAVVYDEAPPQEWPHVQVPAAAVPRLRERPWLALMEDFARAQANGLLLTDLNALTVDQLTYVIDAPLPAAEWAWARRNVRLERGRFLKAYDLVAYDHGRERRGQFHWRGQDYALASIRRLGGICTDQAYFAAMAGKAHGLPTLCFVGEGEEAGHAWFGVQPDPAGEGRWRTNAGAGRVAADAIGYAYDPQNWTLYSEYAFLRTPPGNGRGRMLRRLAGLYASPAKSTSLLHEAIAKDADDPATWWALADVLEGRERADHLERMATQFRRQPAERIGVRLAQLADADAAGDTVAAERVCRELADDAVAGRRDLALHIAGELLRRDLRAGRYREAVAAFKARLRSGGKVPEGETFYGLVWPFVANLSLHGQEALARDSLSYARRALNIRDGSRLHQASIQLERQMAAGS